MAREKVAVAMSGGVDSSVAASLLVDQGYEVTGFMLKLWADECDQKENACCPPEAIKRAREVAAILGIPFYVLDIRDLFKSKIVDTFVRDYASGITPNPCFNCNRWIRWGYLLDFAEQNGNEFLATGHYAILEPTGERVALKKGIDDTKDQSYVLAGLTQGQLQHTLLPLGGYRKSQIRKIAQEKNLPVWNEHDSQDLCFVGKAGYRDFLKRTAPEAFKEGRIVNRFGGEVGRHSGLANFTIGQRKGLGSGNPEPVYVVAKDIARNEVVVGTRSKLGKIRFEVRDVNVLKSGFSSNRGLTVKNRYKAAPVGCVIVQNADGVCEVTLEKPVSDITAGQIAVFYDHDEVVASGIIQ